VSKQYDSKNVFEILGIHFFVKICGEQLKDEKECPML
jgi:hypothetical protein